MFTIVRGTEISTELMESCYRLVTESFDFSLPGQMLPEQLTEERYAEHYADSFFVALVDGKHAGQAFAFPTTERDARSFLEDKITEEGLFARTDALERLPTEALYLCAATVWPEYRGRGIATACVLEVVRTMLVRNPCPLLFYWAYSAEGRSVADAVSRAVGLPVLEKQ